MVETGEWESREDGRERRKGEYNAEYFGRGDMNRVYVDEGDGGSGVIGSCLFDIEKRIPF